MGIGTGLATSLGLAAVCIHTQRVWRQIQLQELGTERASVGCVAGRAGDNYNAFVGAHPIERDVAHGNCRACAGLHALVVRLGRMYTHSRLPTTNLGTCV